MLTSLSSSMFFFVAHSCFQANIITVNPVLEAAASKTDLLTKWNHRKAKIVGPASIKHFNMSIYKFFLD